jgi:hypothetical protein
MSLWTTKLVRHFIATRLGVEYCRERVRQLLHALGFRLRRLCHRHLKGKHEEQAAFRAELEELLGEWPEDWELVFVDEATVHRHPTLTAQWCLVDDVPEVPTGDIHTEVHVYGAGEPTQAMPLSTTTSTMTAEVPLDEFAPGVVAHLSCPLTNPDMPPIPTVTMETTPNIKASDAGVADVPSAAVSAPIFFHPCYQYWHR